jgi:DNA-binding response OmpR family regulator
MSNTTKILVVDDEPVGRQLLEAILVPEGYEIYFGEDGEEAIKVALSELPDIILLDVMMPKLDGFEVCKNLRQHDSTAHIPIFLITALDDRDSRIRGIDMGADDYISKPFDRIEILAKIKNKTSQITIRSKGSQKKPEEIPHNIETGFSEALVNNLIEVIHQNMAQYENLEFFRSKKVIESQHSFYYFITQQGRYICLLSNNIPPKDSSLANSVYIQFIFNAAITEEYQPHKLLANCKANIDKLINKSDSKILNANEFSIIILFIQNKSKEVFVSGQNYSFFVHDLSATNGISRESKFQTITVEPKLDIKFSTPGKIILLTKNILNQTSLPNTSLLLDKSLIDSSGNSFIDRLKENYSKIDDFLVAQLMY